MRGQSRPLAAPIERKSPDEIIAAFAGLKQPGEPAPGGLSTRFLGGMAAGLVIVGALGGWMLFGPSAPEGTAAPEAAAAVDLPLAASGDPASAPPETLASARQADGTGEAFDRVFPGGTVIPDGPDAAAQAAADPVAPSLPDPEDAAVRSAPRTLAAPTGAVPALPRQPAPLPDEGALVLPAAAPAPEPAPADAPADPKPVLADDAAADPAAPAPVAVSDTLAAADRPAPTDRTEGGAEDGAVVATLSTSSAGSLPVVAAAAEPAEDALPAPEADPEVSETLAELRADMVQQAVAMHQAAPRAIQAGIVDIAPVPASWDGGRAAAGLERPLAVSDAAPRVLLPPAPPTADGVAIARPRATPDGVEGTEGVTIFAGDPPRTPPARPEAPPVVLGAFPDPALAGYRPRLRSPEAAARWLEAEKAALASAEALAEEAADPSAAVAEPASAELAAEPEALPGGAASPDAAVELAVARAAALPFTATPPAGPGDGEAVEVSADPLAAGPTTPEEAGDMVLMARPAGPGDPHPRRRPEPGQDVVAPDAIAAALAAAESFQSEIAGASDYAVAASRRPGNRTTDLTRKAAAILEQRQARAQAAAATSTTQTAAIAAAPSAAPSLPTRASVAKAATFTNALPMRKTALVGTYGNRSSRRALIRTENGRYVKVEVGDRIDGGRVQAIGNGVLVYVKGGRKVTLEVPGS